MFGVASRSRSKTQMKRTPTVKITAPAVVAAASAPVLRSRRTDAVVLGEASDHEFMEMSPPPIYEIPNPEFVEDDDDIIDIPLVAPRETSRSPFRRDNVGTRSSSRDARASMEQLRSVLANASASSVRAGNSGEHSNDSDISASDLEEATVPLLESIRPSTPSSASAHARKGREDSGRPTTLSTSVAMAPHSVSSSAITYTQAASSSGGPRRSRLVLPTTTTEPIRRPESPMVTSSAEEREMRAAWEDEGYRAFRFHQVHRQRAAAADGRSESHPMYRQENAGTNFHTLDRGYMGNMNGLPLDSRLVSDEALRLGFDRGYLNPSTQRYPGRHSPYIESVGLDRGQHGHNPTRKLDDLTEEDLVAECRQHNERLIKSSRSALDPRGPSSIPWNDPRYGPQHPDATIPSNHAPALPPASDPRRPPAPRKGSKADLQLQLDRARAEMDAYRRRVEALGPLDYMPHSRDSYFEDRDLEPPIRRNVPAISTLAEMAMEDPPRFPARRSHSFQGTSPPLPPDMMYARDAPPPLEKAKHLRQIPRRVSNPSKRSWGGDPDGDGPPDGSDDSGSDIISDGEDSDDGGPRIARPRRPWALLPDNASESSVSAATSGRSGMAALSLTGADLSRAAMWRLVHTQLMGGDPEAPLDIISVIQAVGARERVYVTLNGAWYRKVIIEKKRQHLHGMPMLPSPIVPSPLLCNSANRANCMPNNALMFEQNHREDQAALQDNARRIFDNDPSDQHSRRLNDMIIDETNLFYEMLWERLALVNLRPTPGTLTVPNTHHISGWLVFIVWWHSRITRWLHACYHAPRSETTDLAIVVKSLTKGLPESFTTHVANVLARPAVELHLVFGLRYLGYKCAFCLEPGSPHIICIHAKCHPTSTVTASSSALKDWNSERNASVNATITSLKAAKTPYVRADLEKAYSDAHPKPIVSGPRSIAYLLKHQDLVPIEPAVVLRLAHYTA